MKPTGNNDPAETDADQRTETQRELDLGSHDVIYALRTAHQHQSQLLVMADQKANILVGILAVMLTIIFTKAEYLTTVSDSYMISVAIFILLEGSALVLALLVITPKTIGKVISPEIEHIPNPFFFGFFTTFTEDQYLEYMSGKLRNDEAARMLLARDLYQVGLVLKKKYMLLKYTYLLAVGGVLLVAVATIVHLLIG